MEGAATSVDNTKKLMDAIRAGDNPGLDALLSVQPELLRFTAPNGSSVMMLTAYYGQPEFEEERVKHRAKHDVITDSTLGDLKNVRKIIRANHALATAI